MLLEEVHDKVSQAVLNTLRTPVDLHDDMTFIGDLGYDSLRVASLSIALEEEFGQPILLNDWLAASDGPMSLTIGSLNAYIAEVFGEGS
jgi:acyl carrier protein